MAAYEVEEGVVSTITGDTLEKARRELSEDPEKRLHAIKELRAAIDRWEESAENEEKLKFTRKDGKFLLRFLRTKKFNVDRSLQLYVNYHKYRYKHSELLGGADGDVSLHHESVEHVLDCGLVTVLDARTVRGEKVLYVRPAYLDLEKISSGDVVKTVLLILDKLIEDEETQVHGFVLLEDLTDVGLYKMMQVAGMEHFKRGVLFELIQVSNDRSIALIMLQLQVYFFRSHFLDDLKECIC